MTQGFWTTLPRPIVGLSPMDGVTNAAFRRVTSQYGPADVSVTEFVPTDGLMHKAVRLLRDFVYCAAERPVVAQIYGCDPQACYVLAHLICELGFDGLDLNMGCPAKKVERRGAGAGLIRTPDVAQAMIREAKRGVADWVQGQDPIEAGVPKKLVMEARRLAEEGFFEAARERRPIPVSVKTRIGYDQNIIQEWVEILLEEEPAVISVHGRTLKQMYKGDACWDTIAMAAECAKGRSTLVLGNGDLSTPQDVVRRVQQSGVDGVLIGRAAMGNPWLFQTRDWIRDCVNGKTDLETLPDWEPSSETALRVCLEHARLTETIHHNRAFCTMFRLMKNYSQSLPLAAQLRKLLFAARSTEDLVQIIRDFYTREMPDAPSSLRQVQMPDIDSEARLISI